jgi:quinoprotein glucose dehydrogenase
VHHDIWDHDVPAAPTLIEVKRGGRTIPGIAVINKTAILFLLDRVTGEPLYEVKETPMPQSDAPGEASWATQPVPVRPPTLARESFRAATDIATVTPELQRYCADWIAREKIRDSVRYTPLSTQALTARFPGSGGGANWGGGAFDPRLGYYVINTVDQGSAEQLAQNPDGSWGTTGGPNAWFADPTNRLMCQQPPWGSLYAVNVNSGEIAWRSTLGVSDNLPEAVSRTGRPSAGGPMLTAGGLAFIAATDDGRFRAFDTRTGAELWTVKLPAASHGTPISYLGRDRQQYVALVATGGSFLGTPIASDEVIAWKLGDK